MTAARVSRGRPARAGRRVRAGVGLDDGRARRKADEQGEREQREHACDGGEEAPGGSGHDADHGGRATGSRANLRRIDRRGERPHAGSRGGSTRERRSARRAGPATPAPLVPAPCPPAKNLEPVLNALPRPTRT
ncbi:hypothetical protein GCM10010245_35650 [Streptomyces spectabilis]|nr:hypothetical protein GCM10010245_35650 [Streptomyces spectabilis]